MKTEAIKKNKFKQLIQVQGHPKEIFVDYNAVYYSIVGIIDGKEITVNLGKFGALKVEILQKMGIKLVKNLIPSTKHVRLTGVSNAKQTSGYTLLEIAGATEIEMQQKVKNVKTQLHAFGITFEDRCEWVCINDVKHQVIPKTELPCEIEKYVNSWATENNVSKEQAMIEILQSVVSDVE